MVGTLTSVSAVSEEAEEIEEEVDEVEVEGQAAEQGQFHHGLFAQSVVLCHHPLDFLRVIGRQTGEDEDPEDADNELQGAGMDKHVHHTGDDDADECHDEDASQRSQIALDGISHNAHRSEGSCGNEEGGGNALHGVGHEDEG